MDVGDSRIAYSATISEELAAEYLESEEREYVANIRVFGEAELGYDEIQEKINKVAEDIGYDAAVRSALLTCLSEAPSAFSLPISCISVMTLT